MSDNRLHSFTPRHEFFIGIDSDGCAFDSMEIKHKECFIPNTIKHFGLQSVARYARQAAEFVNLYSKWRGANRFPALLHTLDLLADHPAVRGRNRDVPKLPALRAWLKTEPRPGNPALRAACAQATGAAREELELVLRWSDAVNAAIDDMVHDLPPFPAVRPSLERAAPLADLIVVSATPSAALEREWREHDLDGFVAVIAGQEHGRKDEHLKIAAQGRYAPGHVLMIGDAPGDRQAAAGIEALFYPITPGREQESWERFEAEALQRFLDGTYAGEYEQGLFADFEAQLPDTPPWATAGR